LKAANELEHTAGIVRVLKENLQVERLLLARPDKPLVALTGHDAPLDPPLRSLVQEVTTEARRVNAPQVGRHAEGQGWYAVGVSVPQSPDGSVWVALLQGDVRRLPLIAEAMEIALETFTFRGLSAAAAEHSQDAALASAAIELIARIQNAPTAEAARRMLVREIAESLGDVNVLLALPSGTHGTMHPAATSDDSLNLRDARIRQSIQAAADESVIRGELSVIPTDNVATRHALMAHRHAAEVCGAPAMASIQLRMPVQNSGSSEVQGVLLVLGENAVSTRAQRLLSTIAEPVATSLNIWKKTEKGGICRFLDRIIGGFSSRKGLLTFIALTAIVGAMFMPTMYYVKCDCEVQPAQRRFVAAQFDGTLERAFVEPGDIVETDMLLARLDGREIRWELAALSADMNKAATEKAGYVATRDPGAARISELEVERLELKSRLLQHRSDKLEVRAPVAGIVISGDHKESEGMPVESGQTLFEIAPLERMTVDVRIPADEVALAKEGQVVELLFEAYPEQAWEGTIRRIHPRSETAERQHFFVAEVELDNAEALLRPGVEGRAAVTTKSHTLGWNLFHRAWHRTVLWAGW